MLVRPVTIMRPTEITDRYGATVPYMTTTTNTETVGWLSQTAATEPVGPGRPLVTVTVEILFLPAGTDIAAHDHVDIDGTIYEVDGTPNPAWTPHGEHHIEAKVRRVAG